MNRIFYALARLACLFCCIAVLQVQAAAPVITSVTVNDQSSGQWGDNFWLEPDCPLWGPCFGVSLTDNSEWTVPAGKNEWSSSVNSNFTTSTFSTRYSNELRSVGQVPFINPALYYKPKYSVSVVIAGEGAWDLALTTRRVGNVVITNSSNSSSRMDIKAQTAIVSGATFTSGSLNLAALPQYNSVTSGAAVSQQNTALIHGIGSTTLTFTVSYDIETFITSGLFGNDSVCWMSGKSNNGVNIPCNPAAQSNEGAWLSGTLASINSDTTPPVISAQAAPSANATGWNNTNVNVSYQCSDSGSGVANCASPVTVSNEGQAQIVTGAATDNSGNTASTSVTLNIDKTVPAITAAATPVANAAGWNNANVAVAYTCNDTLSGIATCPPTANATTEGLAQAISGTAIDKAGNSAVASATLNIDKTVPTITAAATPAANAAGWNNASVTVAYSCDDALSGIATCPENSSATTEGLSQAISGTAVDKAGNSAVASATLNIDKTAPTITAAATPAANAEGWNNASVTVAYSCDDALSGIATCPENSSATTEGLAQAISGTAVDKAGNSAVASATLNIDKTAPTITAAATPIANAEGWNNASVTVAYDCSDALSGIATCPENSSATTEGLAQAISGTAIDKAGNSAVASATLNIDKTAPTITAAATPAANAEGWNNASVTVAYECSDALSGIATCPENSSATTEGLAQAISGTAIDKAGNSAVASATLNIDKTAPAITAAATPAANAAGWNNASVTVAYSCDDALSGIATCPENSSATTEGLAQAISGTAIDKAGNSAVKSTTLNIDKTAPTITAAATPAANAEGWNNASVTVAYSCDDALSGIATCPPTANATTEGLAQAISGTAIDKAGNSAVASATLNIDKTVPTITAAATPAANAAGWNNASVTVAYSCDDALSGIATCPENSSATTEGLAQAISGTAIDKAGNGAVASATLNIDKTAPTITAAATPVANAAGWNNASVTVAYDCSDALSGIATCPENSSATTEGLAQAISGTAIDKAGNSAVASATLNIDKTAPTITAAATPAANAEGWNNASVTVAYDCSDALSGIATCPENSSATTEGLAQAISGTAIDKAGNSAAASATLNIDKTAPTITAAATPAANAEGWNNASVTVAYDCSDALSGIATCPENSSATTEGFAQAISGTTIDKAGNSASASATLNIDKTAPTITAVATPAANAEGWNNASVTVAYDCSDTLSGIATCPESSSATTEGLAQAISGTAIDKAGNSAVASATLNIDKTAPTITAAPTPAANAEGWNNASVTVAYECSDALSGIATCPEISSATTEGLAQAISGTAIDKAGNSAVASATLNIDKTAPTITAAATPAANAEGWNNASVTVAYDCSDALSGIATCPENSSATTEGLAQAISGTAIDKAGNSASASATLNIDKTAPTITAAATPAANAEGWNNASVTVAYSCEDALSGIATCPENSSATTEGLAQAITGTAIDKAGNSAVASATLNIDKTAPTITAAATPAANAAGWNNASVTVAYSCDDALSGIATCPENSSASTEGLAQAISGTAVDKAGNSAVKSTTLNIDKTAPTITAQASNSPNAAGWYKQDVTVNFSCDDALSGIDTCSDPQIVSIEGAAQTANGTASDKAGNTATTTLAVNLDKTAPVINVALPATSANASITVSGNIAEQASGIASAQWKLNNGSLQSLNVNSDGSFDLNLSLQNGSNAVLITAVDLAGNSSNFTGKIYKTVAPVITSLSPANGAELAQNSVTLQGTVDARFALESPQLDIKNLQQPLLKDSAGRLQWIGTDQTGIYQFTLSDYPLVFGANNLVISASTTAGIDTRNLLLQVQSDNSSQKPELTLLGPASGSLIAAEQFLITGTALSHAGSVQVEVDGNPATVIGDDSTQGTFKASVQFAAGETARTVTIIARDSSNQQTVLTALYRRDADAPVITLDTALQPLPAINETQDQPYTLSGTVSDANLASLTINDEPLTLTPGTTVGSYHFRAALLLSIGEASDITLVARDGGGNETKQTYSLQSNATAGLQFLLPANNAHVAASAGVTVDVMTTLQATAFETGDRLQLSVDGGIPLDVDMSNGLAHATLAVATQSGVHQLEAVLVSQDNTVKARATRSITVDPAAALPALALTRTVPGNNATGVEPAQPVQLYFNQIIDPAKLTVTLYETLHGQTYVDNEEPGVDPLSSKGLQLSEVHRDRMPLLFNISMLEDQRTVELYPQRVPGYNAQLFVDISYEDVNGNVQELDRISFTTRQLPTLVTGAIVDQDNNLIPGISVSLPSLGRSAVTNEMGVFSFGFGDPADASLPEGRYTLVLNPDGKNPYYGTHTLWASIVKGRLSDLGQQHIIAMNPELAATPVVSGQPRVLLGAGTLELDLSEASLRFANGGQSGNLKAQWVNRLQSPYDIDGAAGYFNLQPEGVEVTGVVGIRLEAPQRAGGWDYLPQPDPAKPENNKIVVFMALNQQQGRLVPVGFGHLEGHTLVSDEKIKLNNLSAIGYAWVPEANRADVQTEMRGQ